MPVVVQPIRILLVEDDEADIMLAQRAFERANIWNKMDVVRSGQEALDYVYNEGDFTDRTKYPRPGLILLDLNLPGIDGRDVLDKLHRDQHTKTIPVVILTISDYTRDIEFCRMREVQHYLIKPIQVDNVMETFTAIRSFRIILGGVEPNAARESARVVVNNPDQLEFVSGGKIGGFQRQTRCDCPPKVEALTHDEVADNLVRANARNIALATIEFLDSHVRSKFSRALPSDAAEDIYEDIRDELRRFQSDERG